MEENLYDINSQIEDKEFAIDWIEKNGSVKDLSNKMKDDMTVAIEILKKDPLDFKYISDRLKQTKSMALTAIENIKNIYPNEIAYFMNLLIPQIPKNIRKDYNILKKASIVAGEPVNLNSLDLDFDEQELLNKDLSKEVEEDKHLEEEIKNNINAIEMLYDNLNYIGYTKDCLKNNMGNDLDNIKNDIKDGYLTIAIGKDDKDYLWYGDGQTDIAVSLDTKNIYIGEDVEYLFDIHNLGQSKHKAYDEVM